MDLTTLARYATEAEAMPPSATLGDQCYDFAVYAERTRWHRTAREEARQIARRFRAVYRRCVGCG